MTTAARSRLLQALKLKGRVAPADLPAAVGLDDTTCAALLTQLTAEGHVEDTRGRLKLTGSGRDHLTEALAGERRDIDQAALAQLYHEFDEHNRTLKTLMARWQLRDQNTPNDHSDSAYDEAVIVDLLALDERFGPLLARMVGLAPRLSHYPPRFATALQRVRGGDHSWFARPLADSYHTVWFELHEDLIGLTGRTRAEEAAAGRAE